MVRSDCDGNVAGSYAPAMEARFESVPAVRDALGKVDYLADEGIAGVVYLALVRRVRAALDHAQEKAKPTAATSYPYRTVANLLQTLVDLSAIDRADPAKEKWAAATSVDIAAQDWEVMRGRDHASTLHRIEHAASFDTVAVRPGEHYVLGMDPGDPKGDSAVACVMRRDGTTTHVTHFVKLSAKIEFKGLDRSPPSAEKVEQKIADASDASDASDPYLPISQDEARAMRDKLERIAKWNGTPVAIRVLISGELATLPQEHAVKS